MTMPTRRCRSCDVAWAGTLACWLCGAEGDDKYTAVIGVGPDLSMGWDMPYDEDAPYFMWAGY